MGSVLYAKHAEASSIAKSRNLGANACILIC